MDRFSVNGEDLRKFYSPQTALAQVFSDIEKDLVGTQMVVCQFIVNGVALSEADEFKYSKVCLDEVEKLEYLVDKSSSLITGVLEGWIRSLPELIKMTDVLAKKISKGEVTGIYKKNYDLVENCEYLVASVKSIRTLLGDKVGAVLLEWDKNILQVETACRSVLQQFENKNHRELAATLEYDLGHALQCLLEDLVKLDSFLNGGKGHWKIR